MPIHIGTDAPDFTLLDNKRESVQLSALRGKNVVLAFIPAAFTPVCERELCTFRDSLAQFNDLEAVVYGISVDAPFSNGAFADKNNLSFRILSDYARTATNAYDVAHENFANMPGYTAAKRSVFVVDKQGKVRYAWVAENPGIEPNYEEVQAAVKAL